MQILSLTETLAHKNDQRTLLTGVETVIVAKDISGLDNDGTRELCRWTARAILSAALAEAGK